MSYTNNLKEPQEMMNNVFDVQEKEISKLVGKLIEIKCLCYEADKYTKEELIERISKVVI